MRTGRARRFELIGQSDSVRRHGKIRLAYQTPALLPEGWPNNLTRSTVSSLRDSMYRPQPTRHSRAGPGVSTFSELRIGRRKMCSPGLQSGEAGFQTRENALSCNDRALALVRMLRAFEIWQARFVNHRIRDAEDDKHHHTYIWENPVRAGLTERPELFAWSSASPGMELDAPPPGLKP